MVMACKELGVMPTTEGALDMKLDLSHAIDGFSGNEHSMPITPLFNDVVQFWSRSGIFYTPTFIVAYGGPWAENYYYENTEVHDDPKVRHFLPHNLVDGDTRRREIWTRKDELIFPKLVATCSLGATGSFRVLAITGRCGRSPREVCPILKS
jgi:hypothetical protein